MKLQMTFDRFLELIKEHGYRGTFWNQAWTYLEVDGYKYWESRGRGLGTPTRCSTGPDWTNALR